MEAQEAQPVKMGVHSPASVVATGHVFAVIQNGAGGEYNLMTLWQAAKKHPGLLRSTFYNVPDVEDNFVSFAKSLSDALVVAVLDGNGSDEIIHGFGWLNLWTGAAAAAHVCLFPVIDTHVKVSIGRAFIDWVFYTLQLAGGEPYRLGLFGLTPESYTHAIRFAENIGMRKIGTIPSGAKTAKGVEDLVVLTIRR